MTDKYDSQRLREIGSRIEGNVRKDWGLEIIEAAMEIESKAAEIERLREALADLANAAEEAWGSDRPCVRIALAALSGEPT